MATLIEWFEAERGRRSKLAAACGITHGAISQWDRVPSERVLEVERFTGISRHELRPDIFGPAPERTAAE